MGIKGFFASAAVAATAASYEFMSDMDQTFLKWIAEHGRNYHSLAEYLYRLDQFTISHQAIKDINEKPGATSFAGHNKFSDWSREEKENYARGNAVPNNWGDVEQIELDTSNLPSEVNWVTAGAVGPVRDQGQCGSCWAFSAVASMEGHHQINSGELLDLAEQQCVDCDTKSYGCNGGW